ncbi:hypothetical protein EMPG_16258 [Blastomyces silverae]|uniref:Uncharacterized protein n=1 Tax=Blastomyces silverae TaxID=2060906 RepID=A0A0H1BB62_9EURO|nr:hypothetical protein EMPG_16258 [Blastomyces silverae]
MLMVILFCPNSWASCMPGIKHLLPYMLAARARLSPLLAVRAFCRWCDSVMVTGV